VRIPVGPYAFVLDALDVSIILVGFDSRIVWFSTAAERLIEETTELQMHGGLLLLNGNTITHHWLASTEKVRRWSAQLLIRNSGKPLPLLIQETALLDDQRPGFVLQLADFDMPGTSRSAVLQSLYGLTHSEARFADAFVTQCDIKKTAEKLGISEQAARFTIKAIFRKTGTCKQAQFVKLLFSLPGL
jgi:DNA-binding CsgD family transcriptional regulator